MSHLNYSQCLISLLTLKIGGNGVYKIFLPLAESITVSIIYLLVKHFEHIYFVKQSAGSPGSSEIYMIAINKLHHLDNEEYLLYCFENFNNNLALFPKEIYDEYYLLQMHRISKDFVDKQIETLNRSIFYYDWPKMYKEHEKYIEKAKEQYAKNWIYENKFIKLEKKLML